jgi:hydroxypyruvate isomerase
MKGHPDYFCDQMEMGVEVCKAVGSPYLKMLFDIYHVQIMQGDVTTRLEACAEYIGHVHTAGNPGRCEIGPDQEINYAPLMRTLLKIGYKGYVGQEFIPKNPDKIGSLREAVRICDV